MLLAYLGIMKPAIFSMSQGLFGYKVKMLKTLMENKPTVLASLRPKSS